MLVSTKTLAIMQFCPIYKSSASSQLRTLHVRDGAGHRSLVLFVSQRGAVEFLSEVSADAEAALRGDAAGALEKGFFDGEGDLLLGH